MNDQNLLPQFKDLVGILLSMPNSPTERKGYEKANFINRWLNNHGVYSNIIEVENLDPNKAANKDNKWYNVEAVVGDIEYKGGVNGALIVHHDTISHETSNAKFVNGRHYHNTIQDDTIHVAAAMLEIVNLNNWYESHKDLKDSLKGRIKLIISDGEEVNTLGVRGLLKYWEESGDLYPFHFLIIGESTGEENSYIPGIAYLYRGKATGSINLSKDAKKERTYDLAVDFLIRMKSAQCNIYECSRDGRSFDSGLPHLLPSTLCVTLMNINEDANISWEVRTDKLCDTKSSFKRLNTVMESDLSNMNLFCEEGIAKHFSKKIIFDPFAVFSQNDADKKIITASFGQLIHPGAYRPESDLTIYSVIEAFLAVLDETEKNSLKSINLGNQYRLNCIPNSVTITFNDQLNLVDIQNRIMASKDQLSEKISLMYREYLKDKAEKKGSNWSVEADPNVPPRDSLGNLTHNEWIVDTASRVLRKNIKNSLGGDPQVKLTVFNAMNDCGPMSYKNYYNKVWKYGENVITLGVGDFRRLHGEESLSEEEFTTASVQYWNLLSTLFLKANNRFYPQIKQKTFKEKLRKLLPL